MHRMLYVFSHTHLVTLYVVPETVECASDSVPAVNYSLSPANTTRVTACMCRLWIFRSHLLRCL